MAKQRSSFAKLQRDKAKKERAAQKRANRQQKQAEPVAEEPSRSLLVEDGTATISGEGELSASELLTLIEDLHNRRENGTISLEDFEEAKVELFARLQVD